MFWKQSSSDRDNSRQTDSRLAQSRKSVGGRTLSFLNQKGGVGKTTLAFNTSWALATRGHKVLMIDFDPQANLSLLVGPKLSPEELDDQNRYSVFDLIINSINELKSLHRPVELGDVLVQVQANCSKMDGGKLDLIPSSQDLSGFDLTVAGIQTPRQLILKKFIEKNQLKEKYDFIVIDGPPTLGLIMVNIICASDGLFVPFLPDRFSQAGLEQFEGLLEQVEDMGISELPQVIGRIPNLVESRRSVAQDSLKTIEEKTNPYEMKQGPVLEPLFNRVQLAKALANGKAVFEYQSKEYEELKHRFTELAERAEQAFSM